MKLIGFALLGPLIPTTLIALIPVFSGEPQFALAIILVGYIIGIIPSVISTIFYYFMCKSNRLFLSLLPSIVKGAISGAIPGIVIGALLQLNSADMFMTLTFLFCCIFAGAACGYIFKLPNKAV